MQTKPESIGLVLAGGGARGAYEMGALSALLPPLAEQGQRPGIIVGTSVGAINAAYLAATADQPLQQALIQGCDIWRQLMHWKKAVKPLGSLAQFKLVVRAAADAAGVPGAHSWSLLDPTPLEEALRTHVPVEKISANVREGTITAAAVVTTRASTSLSVVFCVTQGSPAGPHDPRRGIEYQRVDELGLEHVLASAAIPSVFPAVELKTPQGPRGWYSDGGTRLNTPTKPAIELGADRVIIVALQSPRLGVVAGGLGRPEVVDGASQLLQAVLVDPLVNDIHTLSMVNDVVQDGSTSTTGRPLKRIPYILVAPEEPYEIGRLATSRFHARYTGLKNLQRRYHSVARLGRLLDVADNEVRGELFSYLFFDSEFAEELIGLGRRDAERWLEKGRKGEHDMGLWRTKPL